MGKADTSIFHPLTLAVLTISDSRTHENDTSGERLKSLATEAGHQVVDRQLLANRTLVIAMPGSGNACELAWHELIQPQLDSRTRPCSFYTHLKPVEA